MPEVDFPVDYYTQANRANWDAWAEINWLSTHYDVDGFKTGHSSLKSIEREEVGDVAGKTLLHLQCHFGLDTLSWARLGARVTGVDYSEKAITLARSLAEEVKLNADFICADLYTLPEVLHRQYDIVFTSYGVLFWLKDLISWAKIAARYLKPGGTFYIVEHHPLVNVFAEGAVDKLEIRYPYSHAAEPIAVETHGTYADPDANYHSVEYCWGYSLGDVINAVIEADMRIVWLHEFPYSSSRRFPFMQQGEDGLWRWQETSNTLPLLFSLKATK
jgi:SAM-dependent methyltransferase